MRVSSSKQSRQLAMKAEPPGDRPSLSRAVLSKSLAGGSLGLQPGTHRGVSSLDEIVRTPGTLEMRFTMISYTNVVPYLRYNGRRHTSRAGTVSGTYGNKSINPSCDPQTKCSIILFGRRKFRANSHSECLIRGD
jgi:hypothetical protein